ncbi:MAG: site-specific DNA-methyltransferase [Treponema sp.]|nr:site-specific DNA-methyltransferase [Treponema sp.]
MSTNISKQKREDLLYKIEEIRKYLKNNLYDENARNLMGYLNELTTQINGQKYGLVFEEHREKIDEILEGHLPVLTEEKELFVGNGGEMNFLLEGDNLASLQLLEKTHKGKIDVIYIDPPYNTGKEFIYNDDLVDGIDEFKHSKWLSFMSERLQIAKGLLKATGVIFISIDDNEHCDLKILCDEIFSENNFISDFCVIRAEGGGMAKQVIKGHDYCLVYARNISQFTPLAKEKDIRGKVIEKDGIKYWVQEDWLRKEFGKYGNCHYEELIEYKGESFKKEIDKGIEKGDYILIPKDNGLTVIGKLRRLDMDSSKFYSVLKHLNKNGVNELKELNINFDYPKPTSLIKELVSGATFFNKSSTILDFFAGSGTTGHAVLKLNAEDGGHRKFILCTNNENGICRDITYERLKTVITGERKDGSKYSDGLSGSLKYLKVDFVEITEKEYYEYADKLLLHVRELVELENAVDFEHNTAVAIVLTEEELEAFTEKIVGSSPTMTRTLYLGHDVLLSKAQKVLFDQNGISVKIIPQYYYPELNG